MLTPEMIEDIKKQLTGLAPEEQQKRLKEVLAGLSTEEREQLVGKQPCPFCLIAQGKIPAKKVYEDDDICAVLDINPANKGHTLIFPKEHAAILSQVPLPIVGKLFDIANKVATAVFDAVHAEGTNIVVANGPAAGQTAPHVLVNVIPRYQNDTVAIQWNRQKVEESELEALAETIKEKLPREKRPVEKPAVPKKEVKEQPRIP
ncbi:MAG TPA: HIT family protein [Candidatus Nanoarchaeia archaeon]|nr:HIT family protein [Candidatus Nanoarchaeia archaeon]